MRNRTLLIALALGGCDGLADQQTEGVALATVHGTLSLGRDVEPPVADLRISVLWRDPHIRRTEGTPVSCDSGELTGWLSESPLLEQTVRVDTKFPSGFTLKLTEPPPAAALEPYPDLSRIATAYGQLVVYEDRNDNGRLDPSTVEEASPDLVFGSSRGSKPWGVDQGQQYTIVYLTGVDEKKGEGTPGYSLLIEEPAPFWPSVISRQSLSEAKLDLILDPTPYAQQMACAAMCQLHLNDPVDPQEYLKSDDLGTELDWGQGVGEWVWAKQDGEKTTFSYAKCTKRDGSDGTVEYMVDVSLVISEGCTDISSGYALSYGASADTPVDLGCRAYGEPDERGR